VALEKKGEAQPQLFLVADGGTGPVRWVVNGRPLDSGTASRQAHWPVDGEGFVRVTVIDAEGNSASVQARVKVY